MISNNEDALKLITKAINTSGFQNGKDVTFVDVAANELFKGNTQFIQKVFIINRNINKYLKLIKKYKINSIEDLWRK